MKIVVIVPYYTPDELTKSLYERCIKSIDKRFTVVTIEDKQHSGAAWARNTGLTKAFEVHDPDYITFLDADDEFTATTYDNMIDTIIRYPEAGMIQFNHKRKKANGTLISRMPNKGGTYPLNRLPLLWMSSVNKLYKSSLIRDIKFDESLKHGEDELFILDCLLKTRELMCSDYYTMVYHKDNPNSLSKSTSFDDLIDEQMALLNFLKNHSDDFEICEAIRQRQLELWNNPTYKKVIGGEK